MKRKLLSTMLLLVLAIVLLLVLSQVGYGIKKAIVSLGSSRQTNAASGKVALTTTRKADYQLGERLQPTPEQAKKAIPATQTSSAPYEEANWFALAPKGWDPMKGFNVSMEQFADADPRATDALKKLREEWDNAPIEPSMDGQRIRIAGFAVPLERDQGLVKEFLLVPYFGACIHTPPPPANQIIHVFANKPLATLQTMDTVWISGTLKVAGSRTEGNTIGLLSSVGYQMNAEIVTPYQKQ